MVRFENTILVRLYILIDFIFLNKNIFYLKRDFNYYTRHEYFAHAHIRLELFVSTLYGEGIRFYQHFKTFYNTLLRYIN